MNREEFLRQLDGLLSGISEEERTDALAFYRSYFEDAGEENEASVIAELESPAKVAEIIMKDLGVEEACQRSGTEQSDRVYQSGGTEQGGSIYQSSGNYQNAGAYQNSGAYQYASGAMQTGGAPKKDNTARTLWIVLAVVTCPIWLTLLLVIIAILLGLVAALLGVAVAIAAVMLALVFSGFLLFGLGIANMFGGSAAVGVGLMGGGLFILALGILAVVLAVWVFGVFLPWAVNGIGKLYKKLCEKRKGRAAV